MEKNWKVIINPVSGGKKHFSEWKKILASIQEANINFESSISEYPTHTIKLTEEAILDGFRQIIIIGGDGSLNEVVNGIYSQTIISPEQIWVAHFSVGTGNDWQRTHQLPSSHIAMIEKIKEGKTKLQDVGKIVIGNSNSTKYFINITGIGFDAFVIQQIQQKRKGKSSGQFSYMLSVLSSLIKFKPQKIKIEVDGKMAVDDYIFSGTIGIGKYNGGGMLPLPQAIPDDGFFDMNIIQKISKVKVIRSLKSLYNGTYIQLKEVSVFKGQKIIISSANNILECDGEYVGESSATIEIIPGGFRFIC